MTPNIDTIIKDHVTLTVRCLDRIYLQGYMPKLQTSGGLCYFLRDHLGHPIPSPALFRPMHDRFVNAVQTFATEHAVPLIKFESGQDKDAIVATYRARASAHDGVVVIGVAQEKARAFKAHKRCGPQGGVTFDFSRQSVAVNHYYFYVQDPEWGPAFVKIGTYLPYPIKICLNGHEWTKQQLRRTQVPFTSLDNGFLACADPTRLQIICDQLGPRDLQQFCDRWSHRLPWPVLDADRAAGFDHRVTLCQLEISLTQIFDRPVPNDFGFTTGLEQLPALRALGDDVNRTLLTVERVSHHCTLTTDALDRLQHPLHLGRHRVSALRFGDPRVQALLQALAGFAHLPAGFRHRDLRPRVAALLGRP